MTTATAFGRLFPPALFVIVGVILSVVWLPDPVLMVLAMCAAGFSAAWLIIATVEVSRTLRIEPSPRLDASSAAPVVE